MSENKTYPVPADFAAQANINDAQYQEMYQQSISDPEGFWGEQAEQYVTWFKKWDKVVDWSFGKDDLHIEWFKGATLNVAYNCLDRHLENRGDQVAIIWEGDSPDEDRKITYRELHEEVSKFANVLKSRGVKKGDRVSLYLPMIPEAAVAMLACTRIGAVHSIVFGGFSPDALRDRILDSDCQVVITADQSMRGGKRVPLKANADKAIAQCPNVHTCLVVKRGGDPVEWNEDRDVWYHEAMSSASTDCPAEEMAADDPLFILYTSGSTGKPKGVLHTTGGYLLQAAMTHKLVFDYKDGEVYWCTADVGWVTGHTYIVYGPLTNGAISVMFEGIPTYPDISRFWQVCDKHNVATFYTAPTAIRSLMSAGEEPVKKTSRSSLRLLGTVGEPINPEAWEWYHRVVGDERCPIVDTWWQTETGAHMLTPLPGATPLKPGSATRPFFGVDPVLLDDQGVEIDGNPAEGNLAIKYPWPSMMRTVYGDHKRFFETYFAMYPGYYFTGDGARRDEDGYYWITGRVDDVLNVSGHRLGTAEIESALVLHDQVAEAAVVGYPHDLTGQGIYAYVTLMAGTEGSDELKAELVKLVRTEIGPIAKVNLIQWAPGLPKTRSGKIMRRILRKIAANELESLGDTSTLADPTVVDNLIDNRENR
ncbi:MAG: acetate--CoA ligase [Candidatus Thiodiazotropha sp. (ex Lucina aurantia)]|uniref:Acetyl-coenzyme A synthetase n=1 Tax=Candidatus Thiodiazotropha endolucinida TaxID=1655433 RepID=A0A7Z0VKI9_9GAMM|nr:acetate--CoA ligase [Candidatus Thiodiazotropha endolucinida]MBT3024523.1 acetate--CoA ligase [Candidatus Thiodiazotropha taylori]MBT3039993.1 acetate--CoA ligase [Candidatus Thiodiazotropha sp. (ex Codakia orbicularis)]MBV2104201.1 acetate--CoA ligase [Candidatus Thiodiazotropha sp. (ex Lucina aurantia)]MBV2099006.1 acetate--CoA ligase [Candidatus Thiodiazotropha sp. (ex Codakia orbicularis)]MBV2118559.1 acetate--CoA ligase [Candidatus Thiodiazotropha sp. (ex Lucina aurantia)]